MLPLLKKSEAGRIVNVASELGSITRQGDPTWKYAQVKVLGYCAAKAALNMFTVQLAFELRDQGIAVNSVNPGFTATDLNAHRGQQTVAEGAAEISRSVPKSVPERGPEPVIRQPTPTTKPIKNGPEIVNFRPVLRLLAALANRRLQPLGHLTARKPQVYRETPRGENPAVRNRP